jgi:peptidoglycan hydrolase-like protein with peptidoglycan-binding domain
MKKTKMILVFLIIAMMMSSVSFAALGYGSSGSAVKSVQHRLNQLGYELEEDGNFGPITRDTVKDFQARRGLETDGYVGPITDGDLDKAVSQGWTIMEITTIPKGIAYGYNASAGSGVKAIQIILNDLGENLETDGHYGPLTKAAVKRFQQSKGLAADGYAGPLTRAALYEAWKSKSAPAPEPVPTTGPAKPEEDELGTAWDSYLNMLEYTEDLRLAYELIPTELKTPLGTALYYSAVAFYGAEREYLRIIEIGHSVPETYAAIAESSMESARDTVVQVSLLAARNQGTSYFPKAELENLDRIQNECMDGAIRALTEYLNSKMARSYPYKIIYSRDNQMVQNQLNELYKAQRSLPDLVDLYLEMRDQ